MLGGLSMWELILIFAVVLLLFGAKRIPEIGSSIGKGIREFKSSLKDIEGELKLPPDQAKPKPGPAPEPLKAEQQEDGEPRRLTTSSQ
ncbi:MAG: twin-arginine translocase TatA/TatE family subunit [Gemmatimonadetes bacterium]|nr:twin-arginine translocase TatA/TatE family subunit [Gemmatimonadota bacterium]